MKTPKQVVRADCTCCGAGKFSNGFGAQTRFGYLLNASRQQFGLCRRSKSKSCRLATPSRLAVEGSVEWQRLDWTKAPNPCSATVTGSFSLFIQCCWICIRPKCSALTTKRRHPSALRSVTRTEQSYCHSAHDHERPLAQLTRP